MPIASPMFTRSTIQPTQTIITSEVISTSPTLTLTDSTGGEDDYRVRADADDFYIDQNVGDASWTNRFKFTAGTTNWTVGGSFMDFPVGSAAQPSISFTGDTTTGLYRVGAGVVGISSAGAAAFTMSLVTGDSVLKDAAASAKTFYINRVVTDGIVNLCSGTTSTPGANILLYGDTHATLANKFSVRQGTTDALTITGTQLVTIGASAGTQTHVVNGDIGATRKGSFGGVPASNVMCYVRTFTGTGADADVAAFAASGNAPATATSTLAGFTSSVTSNASATTVGLRTGFSSNHAAKGAGSTITRDVDFYASSISTVGGTGNAILADNVSFSGSFGINFSNTSPSVFGGALGVGGANSTNYVLRTGASNPLTGASQFGLGSEMVATSAATTAVAGVIGNATTADAAFVAPYLVQIYAANRAKGAASTISNKIGVFAEPQTGGAANASISDTTTLTAGSWSLHLSSTNDNYLAGPLRIGATSYISSAYEQASVIRSVSAGQGGNNQSAVYAQLNSQQNESSTGGISCAAIKSDCRRTITDDVTDNATGGLASINAYTLFNVANTKTYTNTDTNAGVSGIVVSGFSNSGSGALAISELSSIRIRGSSVTNTGTSFGLKVGNISGSSVANWSIYSGTAPSYFAGPLIIGYTSSLGSTNGQLQAKYQNTAGGAIGNTLVTLSSAYINTNTAITGSNDICGVEGQYYRAITTNTTDTHSGLNAGLYGQLSYSVASGQTYTNAQTIGHSGLFIGASYLTGGGSLAVANLSALYVYDDSTTNTGTKYGLRVGNIINGSVANWSVHTGSAPNHFGSYTEITNAVALTAAAANTIQIGAKDDSGSTKATLALATECVVEDVGTFTADKKLRVWINGVEYHIALDAV